jgi:peptidyl-prolyl cis-trans isomerase B (cyclophilin B)
MNTRFWSLSLLLSLLIVAGCRTERDYLVTIQTEYGDMKVVLYDATPLHKENFIELARTGAYDSTTFHRVIENFMVQGGDVNAKAEPDPIDYTIPPEFNDTLIHEKGALAAARMGDDVNPAKESSGSQFYIVHGRTFTKEELDALVYNQKLTVMQRLFMRMLEKPEYAELRREMYQLQQAGNYAEMQERIMNSEDLIRKEYGRLPDFEFSQQQVETYTTKGGAPHLDRGYTVFGRVVEGFPVIDSIAQVATGPADRPVKDIPMVMSVEEVKKKELSRRYGIQYPENN